MGVASCRSTFLFLMLSVRLVLFRISIRDLIPFSGPCTSWVFDQRSGPAQPSPARSGPALRAPGAHTPHAPPSLSLIWISRAITSPLPLPPLSPRGALGFGDGDHRILDPEVSSPPLPFSSLSPSPSSSSSPARAPLFSLLARAPALPRSPAARPAPPAPCRGGDPAPAPVRGRPRLPPPRAAAPPPLPRPAAALLRPLPARGGDPARPCSPARGPRRGPGGSALARPPPPARPARPRCGPCPGAASTPCARRPGPRRGLKLPVCR
jgi:hypothetical protein